MARIEPLRALHYAPEAVGSLQDVVAPPYDVIGDELRAQLAAKSPHNVVHVDLPRSADGEEPYEWARDTFTGWRRDGVVVRDAEPALWAMTQDYTGRDGAPYTRHGFFCRVRVERYGPGRIRPHERTHPGPKQDRLRLTRATRANLSPIFSLFPDPDLAAWSALEPHTEGDPWATVADPDGAVNRLWRVADAGAIEAVTRALASRELLIADGHHRYETALTYAEELGGEGEHRYVLMFLCSLSDAGLTVFPTHRLLSDLDQRRRSALEDSIERDFESEPVPAEELEPPTDRPGVVFGYLDNSDAGPLELTLRDQSIADGALAGKPEPYRRLETAVLEAVVFRGALGMSEDDIAHARGLTYSKDLSEARRAVERGDADAAFFLRPTPVEQVREIAHAGESMPPKSTYFYPKVPTGLLFNSLE